MSVGVADASEPAYSRYFAESGNKAVQGMLGYAYQRQSNGFYKIWIRNMSVSNNPDWEGDYWGGKIIMHYRPKSSLERQQTLARAYDYAGSGYVPDRVDTDVTDVWFETCNSYDLADRIADCRRMYKIPG